eukprot:451356-Pleurochrysis_carterae.AAC.1
MGSDIVTASDGSPFAWGPGNATKWISVSVYARRCINQDDCVRAGNPSKTKYLASVQSGYPTDSIIYGPGTQYTNFPPEVENSLPCWGMFTLDGGNSETLELKRKTLIFLLWFVGWATPFGGSFGDETQWTRLNDTPQQYLSNRPDRPLTIYKKVVPAGNYIIDTYLGMYIFADAHGLELT